MRLLINSTQLVKFHHSCKLWKFLLVYRSPNKFQTTRFFGHLRWRQFNLIRLILVSIRTFSVKSIFSTEEQLFKRKMWLVESYIWSHLPKTQILPVEVSKKSVFTFQFLRCVSTINAHSLTNFWNVLQAAQKNLVIFVVNWTNSGENDTKPKDASSSKIVEVVSTKAIQ